MTAPMIPGAESPPARVGTAAPPQGGHGQAAASPSAAWPQLRTLSLGAGVQSTTIYLLACSGVLPRYDAAIFADTGWEPGAVYQHLARLEAYGAQVGGPPIRRVSAGNIRNDALDPEHRFASMPLYVLGPEEQVTVVDEERPCTAPRCGWYAYTYVLEDALLTDDDQSPLWDVPRPKADCPVCSNKGRVVVRSHTETRRSEGMARRQCTSEYKLKPIKQQVRELLGYPHPLPVPKGVRAEVAIGISTDEIGRARDSDVSYMRNVFPLVDLDMSRKDCVRYLIEHGWPDVPKSACKGCPFHGNRQWREMRDDQPDDWADAVDFDRQIRGGSARANAAGQELRGSMFLHRSRVPLDEAPIDHVTRSEWKDRQADVFENGDPDGCSPWTCRSGEAVT